MALKLHPSYVTDIQSIGTNLSNLWLRSDVPMFYDSASNLEIDNPCSMEVINLADIRFRDEPTITIIDEHGNELYVTQPMLVDETFANPNANQVSDWNTIVNKPTTFPASTHTHTFASLTSKPTTIADYGITDAFTQTLADARYPQLSVQYTNPTFIAGLDATVIKTGMIDLARLPALPSANTIVCTTIPAMSAGDQALVAKGTVVIESTTGNTYRYSGSGSVILNASYIQQSDLTPDWAVITNRPTLVSTWTNDAGYLTAGIFSAQNHWSNTQFIDGGVILSTGGSYGPALTVKHPTDAYYRFQITEYGALCWSDGSTLAPQSQIYLDRPGVLNFNNGDVWGIDELRVASLIVGNKGVVLADDVRLTDARVPLAHTHLWADITDRPTNLSAFTNGPGYVSLGSTLTGYAVGTNAALAATDTILGAFNKIQAQLNAKQASGSYLTGNQTITLSGVITGSGTTAITTAIADGALSIAKTSGLQTALDSKAASSHTHTISSLTDNDALVQGSNSNTGAWGKRTIGLGNTVGSFQSGLKSGFYDGNASDNPNGNWCHLINSAHINSHSTNQYQFQIAASFDNSISTLLNSGNGNWGKEGYWIRTINTSGNGAWRILYHSGNLTAPLSILNKFNTGRWPNSNDGYESNGATDSFTFCSTGGIVNVYTDGNFYATDNKYPVWHSGNFDPNTKSNIGHTHALADIYNAGNYSNTAWEGFWPSSVTKGDGNFAVLWKKDNTDVYLNASSQIKLQTTDGTTRTDRLTITPSAITANAHLLGSTSYNIGATADWWGSGFFTQLNVQNNPVWCAINHPTTLSGYGITDAASVSHTHTLASITGTSLFDVKNYLGNSANNWVWFGYTGIHTSSSRYAGFLASKNGDVIVSARYNAYGNLNAENSINGTETVADWTITRLKVFKNLEVAGTTTLSSALVGTTATMGDAFIGTHSVHTGWATFGHSAIANSVTGYNVLSQYDGTLYLNAPSGKSVNFSNNNGASIATVDSSGFKVGGSLISSALIGNWNSCYDYAVNKGRIGMEAYTGEDTLTWATRNSRGNHFGRMNGVSGSPSYFNFLQIKESSGTVFGAIGHAADGNWYVGRAMSGQEISNYYIVWTTKDISIATRDAWNTAGIRVNNLANYSNAYGIDRLYRRDASTASNKYYIYNEWTTGQWYGNAWRLRSANEHSDAQTGIYKVSVDWADQANQAGTIQCFSGTNYQANIDTNRCPDYSGLWAGCVDAPTGTTPFGSSWTWLQEMGHPNASWRFQLASPYFSDNMAYRRKNNGTWMSWRYLLSTNASGVLDNINLKIPGNKTFTIDGDMISNKTISYTVGGSDLTGAGPYNIGPLDRNVIACPVATSIVMQTHTYAYFKIINAIGGTVAVTAAGGATMKRGLGGTATQVNIGAGQTMIVGYTPGFGFYFGYLY